MQAEEHDIELDASCLSLMLFRRSKGLSVAAFLFRKRDGMIGTDFALYTLPHVVLVWYENNNRALLKRTNLKIYLYDPNRSTQDHLRLPHHPSPTISHTITFPPTALPRRPNYEDSKNEISMLA